VLSVRNLQAYYGQARALDGVSIDLAEHQVIGLLGHNGAGKSTLLRSIAGLHRQVEGQITFEGVDLCSLEAHEVAAHGIILVREGARVFDTLSVREHLLLGRRLGLARGRGERSTAEVVEQFPMLATRLDVKAGFLSGGQRQMLALAAAFASDPTCLLLDEPSTGLAAIVVEELFAKLAELAEQGVALLVAEQNPTWVDAFASSNYLLELGRIIAKGSPSAWEHIDQVNDLEHRPSGSEQQHA
jgi:branched-chain amino acid transport system ATP-binding protein